MNVKTTACRFVAGKPFLMVAAVLAAALIWPATAGAEERLPWEAAPRVPGYQAPQSNGSYSQDSYSQDSYRPPVIRQPRANPSQNRYYEPPRRHSDTGATPHKHGRPAPRDYGAYDNRARPAPAYRSGAPYRSEYADPPAGYDRRADYNRNYDNRPYDNGYQGRQSHDRGPTGSYSMDEILKAGGNFFGSVSKGLASVIEFAFKRSGRPNGYILGEGAGGAFIAGLRYGEGTLYTKRAGRHKVYWQGPSIGYDAGAEGSKTLVLVYNLRHPSEIYHRFGGVSGSAYLVGGVGINFQKRKHVILAPIRAGVGLRFGANVGYLKYTRRPTWNPF